MDEPTLGEIARRLDAIAASVRDLVGRNEYSSDQRGLEHRFTDLGHDLEDMRRQHSDDVKAVNERITEEAKTAAARGQWRTSLVASIIPSLVAIAAILVTIWLSRSGK